MQDGEYIVDRWIVGMLRDICESRGMVFDSYSDDWLLEFKLGDQVGRVLGYRFDLNNSVAASIAQDKVATYQVLAKGMIPAVPHVLVRTKVSKASRDVMDGWEQVVIKPLVGTSGHGVRLCNDVDEAINHVEHSKIAAWAAAPYVDIKREIRIVMLDNTPLLTYEKQPRVHNGLKMFNLGLGATPKDIEVSEDLIQLAARAQSELGLRLSTVDIIENDGGEYLVLEINDSIMMEHYARHSSENKLKAKGVYEKIINTVIV